MTLRENIRRALGTECTADILGAYSPKCFPGLRQAWGRLQNLLAILRAGENLNVRQLARLTRHCTKTIHRDLDFLRTQGVKLVYDRARHTDKTVSAEKVNHKPLSQGHRARKLGVSREHLNRVLNGHRQSRSLLIRHKQLFQEAA